MGSVSRGRDGVSRATEGDLWKPSKEHCESEAACAAMMADACSEAVLAREVRISL